MKLRNYLVYKNIKNTCLNVVFILQFSGSLYYIQNLQPSFRDPSLFVIKSKKYFIKSCEMISASLASVNSAVPIRFPDPARSSRRFKRWKSAVTSVLTLTSKHSCTMYIIRNVLKLSGGWRDNDFDDFELKLKSKFLKIIFDDFNIKNHLLSSIQRVKLYKKHKLLLGENNYLDRGGWMIFTRTCTPLYSVQHQHCTWHCALSKYTICSGSYLFLALKAGQGTLVPAPQDQRRIRSWH